MTNAIKKRNPNMLEYLGKEVIVIIDRPMGSKHPTHDIYYPINYGYIPHTKAPDGEEIDAYIVGEFKPIKEFKGFVIAVVQRKNDCEDKLVVSAYKNRYTKEHIEALTEFQERFFESKVIMSD